MKYEKGIGKEYSKIKNCPLQDEKRTALSVYFTRFRWYDEDALTAFFCNCVPFDSSRISAVLETYSAGNITLIHRQLIGVKIIG